MKTARYYLLTLLRVSNTAHLPTKPDQVAKAGRLDGEKTRIKHQVFNFTKTKGKTK